MSLRSSLAAVSVAACTIAIAAQTASAVMPEMPLIQRTYAVADLVVPPPSAVTVVLDKTGASIAPEKPRPTREAKLIALIEETIQPATWEKAGGRGSIQFFPLGLGLVIAQTAEVHGEVADLIAAMRRLNDLQVALEVRLLTVSDSAIERLESEIASVRALGDSSCNEAGGKDAGMVFLDDQQVRKLLGTVQGDRGMHCLKMPRVTLVNGQTGKMVITGTAEDRASSGLSMTATPVLSADRRSVRLEFNLDLKDFPLTLEKEVVIPDGSTMLLGSPRLVDVRTVCRPSILGNIPCIGEFFQTVGYERSAQRQFVLVTPRILFIEECAEAAPPKVKAVKYETTSPRQAKVLAELLCAYDAACTDGQADEAERFARAALAIDPTCFHPKR